NYGGTVEFALNLTTDNKLVLDVRDANSNRVLLLGTTALNDDTRHYVAGVRQGSVFSIYVDGQLAGTPTDATVGQISPGNSYVRIGGAYTGQKNETTPTASEAFFVGGIDEVAFYKTALTQSQILSHYNAAQLAAVPEPASLAIWGIGAIGCAVAGYRRRRA